MKNAISRRAFLATTAASSLCLMARSAPKPDPKPILRHRGYYVLPCRTPTLDYRACRDMVDAMAEDRANTVILWIAGSFRSRKFPVTWHYNSQHANVRKDFMGRLIRHAHTRGIQCLLGFTPFGYDGVNQYPLEHPELKAAGPDGKPVTEFGIHCWGWNLCPAKPESQRFMIEYAREMAFEFYPEADGLFIESGDYAICHCPACGPRHFDHEFNFVRTISEEIWARKPQATIVVYPHYFSGAKLRFSFSEAVATKQPFDPRWTLFFTPHSAALEPELIAQASGSWWWNEAPARFDLPGIRAGARRARESNCTGFMPTLECYSYVQTHEEFGEPWLKGRRQVPFGFGWLPEGASPYRELPLRVIRLAYREYTANPDLSDAAFQAIMGRELFGRNWQSSDVEDALELCRVFGTDRDWAVPAPLTTPGLVASRLKSGRLDAAKRQFLRSQLARVRAIAERHQNAQSAARRDLARISQWILDQWQAANAILLED
ncbi:MAG TPA: hypothetical protein P5186_15040 [Candidatus Paceibacterota bacterium]|nr:hypothetical protein [Candidatus Paceibacterota bacterium]